MSSRNVSHTSTNRLADEKSPYLLQHKDNPVDWYPWGSAAFNRAKDLNKPIFLSIGYSTCHWCHVMERESFENADIAKLMNDNFVCVKVDREERPDVDRIYMTFIQATQGGGGWPLSVFLTPDLKPITGGTYFPPVDRYNRPGFGTILMRIADAWKKRQPEVEAQSTMLLKALRDGTIAGAVDAHASIPDRKVYQKCFKSLAKSFDKIHGGFGSAPKFPQPVNLNVLFRASVLHDTDREMSELSLSMCYKTLDGMAHGGIYDHIGYGFHRYSTDAVWHVPHFEKMLYDNAQLLGSYVEGFQISKNSSYEITARRIVEYISRDLTDGSGGIYSAEDADSYPPDSSGHKKEGAFYVWSELEIDTALPQLIDGSNSVRFSDVFKHHFGVKKGGNVDPYQDPHEELTNQNVLIINGSIEETAKHFSKSVDLITDVLEKSRSILFDIRAKRPRPHLDDKMITAWNGLVLSGLAKAAQALQDDHIKSKAISVATFAQRYLFNEVKGVLLHSVYKGKGNTDPVQIAQPIEGFCEDYACLIRGLLDLYETCFDPEYLKWAYQLQTKQDQLFWDADNGGYFSSHSQDASLLLRLKEETDGAEPSPNSVSLSNLLRLALIFDNENWTKKSISMFKLFSDRLQKIPVAVPEMVSALMFHHEHPRQVIIFGEHTDPSVVALIAAAQQDFVPFKCILLMDKRNIDVLRPLMGNPEVFAAAASSDGVSAHICRNFTCGLPIKDPKELRRQLA